MNFYTGKTMAFAITIFVVIFFFMLPQPETQTTVIKQENITQESSINQNRLSNNFIIRNVQLYDGNRFFNNTDILIKDNRIHQIQEQLPVQSLLPELDGKGKTLIPGLVDAHTHAYGTALADALNFGVTTELDMFTMPAFATEKLAARDKLDNISSADLFSSTILATTIGGHGTEYGFKIPVLTSPEQAKQFVQNRIAQGADYIKAVYNSKSADNQYFPSISKSILQALIVSAQEHNLMLVVHVDNLISAKEAVRLGANGVIHSFMDKVVDKEFVDLMKLNHAFIIPTLSVEATMAQRSDGKRLLSQIHLAPYINKQQDQQLRNTFPDFGIPSLALQNAFDSVKILSLAEITILAGTDAPNPGTSHGISLHGEMELLVKAGLTNEQALHSATGGARRHFPVGLRGTLKIGAAASMVLLNGNPLENISHTQDIQHIWKNGVHYQRMLTPIESIENTKITSGLITNFDSSLNKTKIGKRIGPTTDKYAGGNSEVKLFHDTKAATQNRYLRAKGTLKKGFMFPWGGVAYLPSIDQQHSVDLTDLESISFDARGGEDTKYFSVLLFEKGSFQPRDIAVNITNDWTNYRVALEDFKNIDLSNISNISIVVTNKIGDFEFMIDNLRFE